MIVENCPSAHEPADERRSAIDVARPSAAGAYRVKKLAPVA
jgi:hypothetical protein